MGKASTIANCRISSRHRQWIKKQRHHFLAKVCIAKAMVFTVVTCGYESQTIQKAKCQKIEAFELWSWRRLLRLPWTARRSNHPEGNQSWVFIRRTDAEFEVPVLWPCDAKRWLTGKDPDAGKDGKPKKEAADDEMVGWHQRLNGHEFEQTLGDSGGQMSLVCCSPWGCKQSDTTERLNWTEKYLMS